MLHFLSPIEVKSEDFTVPFGECKIEREGTDVTLVSYSRGVHTCLEAAKALEAQGVSCEVVNIRSLRPLDRKTIIKSVMKTNRLVTVEEVRSFPWSDAKAIAQAAHASSMHLRVGLHVASALRLVLAFSRARPSTIWMLPSNE